MSELAFEEELLRGAAALISGNPAAREAIAWDDGTDPNFIYPEGTTSLHLEREPQKAGGSLTLSEYTVDDDFSLSDSVVGLQIRLRHPDRAKLRLMVDDIFNLLHGRDAGMLGNVTLVSARRSSGTSVGQDSNERQGRIENYYLTVHRPSANRL